MALLAAPDMAFGQTIAPDLQNLDENAKLSIYIIRGAGDLVTQAVAPASAQDVDDCMADIKARTNNVQKNSDLDDLGFIRAYVTFVVASEKAGKTDFLPNLTKNKMTEILNTITWAGAAPQLSGTKASMMLKVKEAILADAAVVANPSKLEIPTELEHTRIFSNHKWTTGHFQGQRMALLNLNVGK